MKLKDLTIQHLVVVTTLAECNAVAAIFDREHRGKRIGGFREVHGSQVFVVGLLTVGGYTDGSYSPCSNLRELISAADFIAANTNPIPDHTTPVYGC